MINRVPVIIALPLTNINKNLDVSSMASLTFSFCLPLARRHAVGTIPTTTSMVYSRPNSCLYKKRHGDSKQSPGKRHHSTAIHLPDCGKLLLDLRQPVLQLSMGDPLNDGHGHHFSSHTAIMAAEHLGHTRFFFRQAFFYYYLGCHCFNTQFLKFLRHGVTQFKQTAKARSLRATEGHFDGSASCGGESPLEVHKRTPKGGTRNDHQTRRSIRPEILGEIDGSSVGNAELKIASITNEPCSVEITCSVEIYEITCSVEISPGSGMYV